MRRKIGMFVLCGALAASLMGCSGSSSSTGAAADTSAAGTTEAGTTEADTTEEKESDQDAEANTGAPEDTSAEDEGENDGADDNSVGTEDTLGHILLKDFQDRVNADSSLSAQELADAVISNEVITSTELSLMTMPVEEGLLSGFDNYEVTGFEEGVAFAPMIGSIPFVGYIFVLEEGADVEGFVADLSENANPRWNVCVEADETVVDYVGNTVFFIMCPESLSE